MTYIPNIVNEESITLIIDGVPETIKKGHANFNKISQLLKAGEHDEAVALLNEAETLVNYSDGDIQIEHNSVVYKGKAVPNYMADKLLSMIRQGRKDIEPFRKHVELTMQNPSFRAREEFTRFCDYKELPIDEHGYVIAWKGVRDNYWSCTGNPNTRVISGQVSDDGSILNNVGAHIEVERADVDDNCNNTCSDGLHAGSWDYASNFGSRVVAVRFSPADVVSVPTDCDGQKVRVCKYTVVADATKESEDAIWDKDYESRPSVNVYDYTDDELWAEIQGVLTMYDVDLDDTAFIAEICNADEDQVIGLLNKYDLWIKILDYVEERGVATYKKICSAKKSYGITKSDVIDLANIFAHEGDVIVEDWGLRVE